MANIRFGIICPSEIAFRRFLPSLQKVEGVEFTGVAIASPTEWFGDVSKISEADITIQQERELAKAKTFVDAFGGKISDIKFSGDFFGKRDVSGLENKLVGIRHSYSDLLAALENQPIGDYFAGLTAEDIAELIKP